MTDLLCLDDVPTAEEFAARQVRETVTQDAAGVTVRLATITCRCGWERAALKMYRCLYCGEWLCEVCAEAHFGKTREQYRAERLAKMQAERHNAKSQATDAALSRQVACTDGLCPGANNGESA